MEENGTRWSKPYVSTAHLASFIEFKQTIQNGVVVLDSVCETLDQLVDQFCQQLRSRNLATPDEANQIATLLLLQKRHQFQMKKSLMRSLADLRQNSSSNFFKLITRSSCKRDWYRAGKLRYLLRFLFIAKVNCNVINDTIQPIEETAQRSQSDCELDKEMSGDSFEEKEKTESPASEAKHKVCFLINPFPPPLTTFIVQ